MLASIPASMLNQNGPDLGIPNRIDLKTSRFSAATASVIALPLGGLGLEVRW